jgi:hypothetical protein
MSRMQLWSRKSSLEALSLFFLTFLPLQLPFSDPAGFRLRNAIRCSSGCEADSTSSARASPREPMNKDKELVWGSHARLAGMLPQYSDGSAKGKGKKVKKKKELSLLQSCILLMVLFWIMGVAGYLYRSLELMHGADANGYIGLVILGPHTRAGQQWIERCEAFFRGVEERFAVPGWSDEIEKSIGKYKEGEYLEQVRAREREITKEVDTRLGSAKLPPALTSLLSPALAKSQEHGGAAFQAGTALQKGESGGAHSSTKDPNALPEGSYNGSCDQCILMGIAPNQQLRCICKNGEGHGTTSVLRLSTCKNGEWVGNLDGILSCEPVPEGADTILRPQMREEWRGGGREGGREGRYVGSERGGAPNMQN